MAERWMTYAEAGAEFRLSPEAVRKRARRLRLATQLGNEDGKVRVLFPDGVTLQPAGRQEDDRPDDRADELRKQISRLEAKAKEEREARTAAEVRAGVAEALATREAEARRDAEARAEREAEGRRKAEAQAAQDTARAVQAEAAAAEARTRAEAALGRLDAFQARPWWKRAITRP